MEAYDAMVDAGKGVPPSRRDRVFGEPLERFDPTEVGPYRLVSRLGIGGMGTVYLSRTAAGEAVAVKVIRADLAANPEFRRRFRAEVEAARRVAPFCTAEVIDADPDAYQPYMVTEFIDGVRLDQEITDNGPLGPSNLTGTAVGVATALTAIHRAGLVHRDLKPSNVILSLSGPRVIDFGISQALDGSVARPTQWGFGSAGWMAPEQVHGEPIGPAADVFTWGILMAYAGTGRHPFGEGTDVDLAYRIVNGNPNLDGLPAPMADLVRATLAKRPDARPTARELLLRLVERQPDTAAPGVLGTAEQALGLPPADDRYEPHTIPPPPSPAGETRLSEARQTSDSGRQPDDRYWQDPTPQHDQRSGPVDAYRPSDAYRPDDAYRAEETYRPEDAYRADQVGAAGAGPGSDGRPPGGVAPPTRPRWSRRGGAFVLGAVLLGLIAVAMFVGLRGGDDEPDSAATQVPPSQNGSTGPEPSSSPTPAAEGFRDGQLGFQVLGDVECGLDRVDGWFLGPTNDQFCVVEVEVRNLGDSARWFRHDQQTLIDADGRSYQASAFINIPTQAVPVLPEGDTTRSLVFDVPDGTEPTSVELQDSDNDGGVKIPVS